jgi:ribosomal protein S2
VPSVQKKSASLKQRGIIQDPRQIPFFLEKGDPKPRDSQKATGTGRLTWMDRVITGMLTNRNIGSSFSRAQAIRKKTGANDWTRRGGRVV